MNLGIGSFSSNNGRRIANSRQPLATNPYLNSGLTAIAEASEPTSAAAAPSVTPAPPHVEEKSSSFAQTSSPSSLGSSPTISQVRRPVAPVVYPRSHFVVSVEDTIEGAIVEPTPYSPEPVSSSRAQNREIFQYDQALGPDFPVTSHSSSSSSSTSSQRRTSPPRGSESQSSSSRSSQYSAIVDPLFNREANDVYLAESETPAEAYHASIKAEFQTHTHGLRDNVQDLSCILLKNHANESDIRIVKSQIEYLVKEEAVRIMFDCSARPSADPSLPANNTHLIPDSQAHHSARVSRYFQLKVLEREIEAVIALAKNDPRKLSRLQNIQAAYCKLDPEFEKNALEICTPNGIDERDPHLTLLEFLYNVVRRQCDQTLQELQNYTKGVLQSLRTSAEWKNGRGAEIVNLAKKSVCTEAPILTTESLQSALAAKLIQAQQQTGASQWIEENYQCDKEQIYTSPQTDTRMGYDPSSIPASSSQSRFVVIAQGALQSFPQVVRDANIERIKQSLLKDYNSWKFWTASKVRKEISDFRIEENKKAECQKAGIKPAQEEGYVLKQLAIDEVNMNYTKLVHNPTQKDLNKFVETQNLKRGRAIQKRIYELYEQRDSWWYGSKIEALIAKKRNAHRNNRNYEDLDAVTDIAIKELPEAEQAEARLQLETVLKKEKDLQKDFFLLAVNNEVQRLKRPHWFKAIFFSPAAAHNAAVSKIESLVKTYWKYSFLKTNPPFGDEKVDRETIERMAVSRAISVVPPVLSSQPEVRATASNALSQEEKLLVAHIAKQQASQIAQQIRLSAMNGVEESSKNIAQTLQDQFTQSTQTYKRKRQAKTFLEGAFAIFMHEKDPDPNPNAFDTAIDYLQNQENLNWIQKNWSKDNKAFFNKTYESFKSHLTNLSKQPTDSTAFIGVQETYLVMIRLMDLN